VIIGRSLKWPRIRAFGSGRLGVRVPPDALVVAVRFEPRTVAAEHHDRALRQHSSAIDGRSAEPCANLLILPSRLTTSSMAYDEAAAETSWVVR
jgi:hypothetical protein